MLEALLLVLLILGLSFIDVFVVRLVLTLIVFVLLVPGVYSMLKGAPFLPSTKSRIKSMFGFADLSSQDVVYELGAGDGRIIRKAANMGVKKAIGIEFSYPTYLLSRFLKFRARSKEELRFQNFWNQDYSDADVIFAFLLDNAMIRFESEIWPTLKKGTKVVINNFPMPNIKEDKKENAVYLYVKK